MPRRYNPLRINELRAREAEYQAMWQSCDRTSRKDEYRDASVSVRMLMLREALSKLLERRRHQGKTMCGTNIEQMVERHVQREAVQARMLSPSLQAEAGSPGSFNISNNASNRDSPRNYNFGAPTAPIAPMDASPNAQHNASLVDEVAACRQDRAQLVNQITELQVEMDNVRGMISFLWNCIQSEQGMAPQTPENSVETGNEHQIMDQAEL